MKTTINNNRVIIVNGSGGSGKDTFVNQCAKNKTFGSKVVHISIVDKVKDIARYCGWDGEKTDKNRKFLSDLMDILTEWDEVPLKSIGKAVMARKNKIIFIDAREPDDIDALKIYYDGITVLIKNDNIEPIKSNHADANVEDYNYDYIIYNNGSIETLRDSADAFLKEIMDE